MYGSGTRHGASQGPENHYIKTFLLKNQYNTHLQGPRVRTAKPFVVVMMVVAMVCCSLSWRTGYCWRGLGGGDGHTTVTELAVISLELTWEPVCRF